ncbi:hypothetical protein JCM11641_000932 [Rhodosporidiobolus odoratus]
MAVRRLARPRLLRSESPSVPVSPCPSCHRSLSSALQLNPHRNDNASTTTTGQASSSWAAWSKAGHALFNSPDQLKRPAGQAETAPAELSQTALDLVNALKAKRSDSDKVWNLFQQLDLQGDLHTLPLVSLHALLPAIHLKPRSSSRRPLSLHASTDAAREYALKVDLIRTRLRQAGGSTTPGDWNALLAQYHALRYAPGVGKVWDEMTASGFTPSANTAKMVLESYLGWVEMHGRTSGRAVERTAAEPLLRKAISILAELQRGGKKVEGVVELLLKLAIKAQDLRVVSTVMKQYYAFDIALPGAAVDGTAQKPLCEIGETEVVLMLEAFAEKDDLPGMIAIFETFDHPAPPSSANPDFFTQSFSASTPFNAAPAFASSPSTSSSASSNKPHPIGSRALVTLIQTASRLANGSIARHYFDLLFVRWQHGAFERMSEIERGAGCAPEVGETVDEGEAREVREMQTEAQESEETEIRQTDAVEVERAYLSPSLLVEHPADRSCFYFHVTAIRRSHSIAAAFARHLTLSPSDPSTPYFLPSTIIGTLAHYALVNYDAPTARWLRIRTRRLIQLMESHTQRLSAVLDKLETPPAPTDANPADTSSTPSPSSSASLPSLTTLKRELAFSTFHLTQLRLTLSSVKFDSNIISAYELLHRQQTTLYQRSKRLTNLHMAKKDLVKARPALRRKEKQVLLSRMIVVRHRLNKLREVEKQGPGRSEFDRYMSELRLLKSKFEGEGTGWTERGENGEMLGRLPHVSGLQ